MSPYCLDEGGNALRNLADTNARIVLQQAPGERLGNAFEHGRPLITRSVEQLLRRKFDIVGYLVWAVGMSAQRLL